MASPVSVDELQDALTALIARDAPPALEPDDITIVRVQKRAGVGWDRAKKMIEQWEAEGAVVSVGKRRAKSQNVDAWKIAERKE